LAHGQNRDTLVISPRAYDGTEKGLHVIELGEERPYNREHFSRLLEFCQEIISICQDLDIEPVLSGSLAVFGYTRDRTMGVNDVDLACSELEFPRLSCALEARGIAHAVREWHVLQARQGDLKVEFDSMEHWMANLPEGYDVLAIDTCVFKVVSLAGLKELYRRGLEATAGQSDQAAKHSAITQKYDMLCSPVLLSYLQVGEFRGTKKPTEHHSNGFQMPCE